jgi:hypothetical protein
VRRFLNRSLSIAGLSALLCYLPAAGVAQAAPAAPRLAGTASPVLPRPGIRGHLQAVKVPWARRALAGGRGTGRAAVPLTPSPSFNGLFEAVDARSATDAWAVGSFCTLNCGTQSEVDHALILRWNGTTWSKIKNPNPGASYNDLFSVSADSATDAWAIGQYANTSGLPHTLVLHWNGIKWSTVSTPKATTYQLLSVAAVSRRNVWAAGFYCKLNCGKASEVVATVILHWNGTKWIKVTSPSPGIGGSILTGVMTISAKNGWAVGASCVAHCAGTSPTVHTLILHWNGTSWSKVKSPNPNSYNFLVAVSPHASGGAWAVGFRCGTTCHPLSLHRTGGVWVKVTTPDPGGAFLNAVDTVSSTDAWAVGSYCASGCGTNSEVDNSLILHWNGATWSQVTSANPGANANILIGVSADSATDAWAVGFQCTGTTCSTLIEQWNGSIWAVS